MQEATETATTAASALDITFLAVGALSIVAVAFLLVVIVRQRRELEKLHEAAVPKYGFLGKPLYAFLAVLTLVAGFSLTYYVSRNLQPTETVAEIKLTIDVILLPQEQTDRGRRVSFKAVPSIDGTPWGADQSNSFDIYWTIDGPEKFTRIELDKKLDEQGGFTRDLRRGKYNVRVDVVYKARAWSEFTDFIVE